MALLLKLAVFLSSIYLSARLVKLFDILLIKVFDNKNFFVYIPPCSWGA
mgnify:CR=1 FL=1